MVKDNGERERITAKSPGQIRRLLGRNELTIRDAAWRIGVSPTTMWRITKNDGQPIQEKSAVKLAKLLNRDFDELFTSELFYVTRDYAQHNMRAA